MDHFVYIDTKNKTYVDLDGIIREDGGETEKNGRIDVSNRYVLYRLTYWVD
jgi:hypothetical protein